jgi:hypothetical protein
MKLCQTRYVLAYIPLLRVTKYSDRDLSLDTGNRFVTSPTRYAEIENGEHMKL